MLMYNIATFLTLISQWMIILLALSYFTVKYNLSEFTVL
jgi:hypothetical protein